VRVIAATNKNLNEAIANNKFREDLYYRINTLAIKIPPLRDRKEDLIYIINKYLKSKYKIEKRMSQDVIDCILAYDWPGNIRELINTAEYICFSSEAKMEIELGHLPDNIKAHYENSLKERQQGDDRAFDRISRDLSTGKYTNEMICQFLAILTQRKNAVCGRNTIQKEMLKNNFFFTEGNMKKILKTMRLAGLITVGKTKQGTVITPEGEKFLTYRQL
jgi:transcriptional regulator with PAS, ATPase and Fis domain